MIKTMIPELFRIVEVIRGWVDGGASREEILERLRHPDGVAAQMIDRAIARRRAGRDYLGRVPAALRVWVDDEESPGEVHEGVSRSGRSGGRG